MTYPIYVYGTSILRKKAKEVPKDYPGLDELIENMFETMYNAEGAGLAAPQIGKSLRLFIIDASTDDEEEEGENKEKLENFKKVFINPEILEETGEEWLFNEGCLSIPLIREDISRKPEIRIRYYDENWVFHDEYYEGIKARIIQHEYDHLDGILFVDKLNPLRRRLLNSKLQAISKGKTGIEYKIRIPNQVKNKMK